MCGPEPGWIRAQGSQLRVVVRQLEGYGTPIAECLECCTLSLLCSTLLQTACISDMPSDSMACGYITDAVQCLVEHLCLGVVHARTSVDASVWQLQKDRLGGWTLLYSHTVAAFLSCVCLMECQVAANLTCKASTEYTRAECGPSLLDWSLLPAWTGCSISNVKLALGWH